MQGEGGPYLAIVENEAQSGGNRFDWRENISRLVHLLEDGFGPRELKRLRS